MASNSQESNRVPLHEPKYRRKIIKLKDDPTTAAVLQLIKKYPVNSSHFSPTKRLHLNEVDLKPSKTPLPSEIKSLDKRAKNFLKSIGYEYGRLPYQKLSQSYDSQPFKAFRAPGPIDKEKNKPIEIDPNTSEEHNQLHLAEGFYKAVPIRSTRRSIVAESITVSPKGQRSAKQSQSQEKAKDYLKYIDALNRDEMDYIKYTVLRKRKEFREELIARSCDEISELNDRKIFSPGLNKARVDTMLSVKLRSKINNQLKPELRLIKNQVLSEKLSSIKQQNSESFKSSNADHHALKHLENKIVMRMAKTHYEERKVKTPEASIEKELEISHQRMLNRLQNSKPDPKITEMPVMSLRQSYYL
jgi:hypothetical protein